MDVRPVRVGAPDVDALLALHLAGMRAASPPSSVHALDGSGLRASDVTLVGAFDGATLLGIGALKELSPAHGEIKSMRTAPVSVRGGVGSAILGDLLERARRRGYRRVSLETGSGQPFDAALALYRRAGFVEGEPFGDYERTEFSRFMHLDLPWRP